MKKLTLSIISFFLLNCISAQVVFTDSNLPIVVIDTYGQPIVDSVKVEAKMGVIYNGPGVRNYINDPYNNYRGRIGIEIRGSTSQQYPKKSYGFETRTHRGTALNVPLLGMPIENDWILYGGYSDKTLMRNEITHHLFSMMGWYSTRFVYCELVIDNQYMGVYTMKERIKIDGDRVNIAKLDSNDLAGDSLTGGYIIKIDKSTGSSLTTWTSPYQVKLQYLYHDPKDTSLLPLQSQYIQNFMNAFEDTVYSANFSDTAGGFRRYIDTQSFIDFFLMQELGKPVDGYRSSSFMYKDKDSKGGKLRCGPMWDFNVAYGNSNYCDAELISGWQYDFASVCPFYPTEPPQWWAKLLQDSLYTRDLKCRYNQLRQTIFSTNYINAWIDTTAAWLDESQQRNYIQWPILGQYVNWNFYIGNTYQDEVNYLKLWILSRISWLDANLPGNCPAVFMNENAVSDANNITVYPNPFTNQATVQIEKLFKNTNLTVYDAFGRSVKELKNISSNLITLTRDDLPDGQYFLQVSHDNQVFYGKKVVIVD